MRPQRRKRANGEGSIYRSGDGTWRGALSVGSGRRRFFSGATREEVARKLAAAAADFNSGVPVPTGSQTVAAYLAGWLEGTRSSIKPGTWRRYEQYVRVHAVPAIGGVRLNGLTPQHLQNLYQDRLRAGSSPTSVHHLHAVLHRALVQAERWGLVARNVAGLVDAPRIPRKEQRVFSSDEVGCLLDTAADDDLEALYMMAVTTGMREGELLGLKWSDIDLDQGKVFIRRRVGRVYGEGMVFDETKTARSARCVLLAQAAIDCLRKHRAVQAKRQLNLGSEWADLHLVFPNGTGRPIEGQNLLQRAFYPLLRRAGLPIIPFHNLRHTAATLLLERGTHPKVVSEMLGHTNISITMDLYSHVTETMQRTAADEMDRLLTRVRSNRRAGSA
jgi:integrase